VSSELIGANELIRLKFMGKPTIIVHAMIDLNLKFLIENHFFKLYSYFNLRKENILFFYFNDWEFQTFI